MCSPWGANQNWCCGLTFSVFFSLFLHLRKKKIHPSIPIYLAMLSPFPPQRLALFPPSLSCSLSFCLLSFFYLSSSSSSLSPTLVGSSRVGQLWLGWEENWLWDRRTQNWVIIVCAWEARSPDEKLQDKRSKWHSIQHHDISGLQKILNPSFT